ncbi:NAD(P)H-binding protein [Winogradskyella litorisediminis]|uniref:NAD(P)H-binding protein n=1 Tax=Winogradskyella litorisediminis TaxID=1156618 RepID=A0ABW3N472_9FLAO
MKNNKISILGCGWLGLSLAKHLLKIGHHVKGSTTTQSKLKVLEYEGIYSFLIQLEENKIEGNISDFLDKSDTLIINIPPGLRKNPNKNHVAEIEQLILQIEKSSIENVLFVSSTSVFKNEVSFPLIASEVKPNATSNSAKQLIEIENLLQNNSNFKTTILRFSGLFGDERHPGKFLSGQDNVSNPDAPINLIHRQDCVQIISKIIQNHHWNITLNATFPKHPSKETFYVDYCKTHDLPLPTFNHSIPSKGKIIDGSYLAQLLTYEYELSL